MLVNLEALPPVLYLDETWRFTYGNMVKLTHNRFLNL